MNEAVSLLPLFAFMVGTGKTVPSYHYSFVYSYLFTDQLDKKRGKIKYLETTLH